MGNYTATIATLDNVRQHPNADRLQLADAAFEQVVIGLDHYDGEVGVFVPAGTVLSPEFLFANGLYRKHPETGEAMGGYIESNGRVRFQRLRGEMSRGLWLPMSCLDYLKLKNVPALGTTFSELEGHEICAKYVERVVSRTPKQGKAPSELFENFYRVGDTPKLVNNLHQLKVGDVLVITEKLHGTSGRTGYMPRKATKQSWMDKIMAYFGAERARRYEVVSGTRNTILSENPYHASDDYRQKAHDLLRPFLQRGQVVYYEIVGPGIMPNHTPNGVADKELKRLLREFYGDEIAYTYGVPQGEHGIYIYKIIEHNVDGTAITYSWDQLEDWCKLRGLNHAPVLDRLVYDGNKTALMHYIKRSIERVSLLGHTHPMEGVVIWTRHGAMKHKSDTFCILEDIRPYDEPEASEFVEMEGN